jgi:hypothetical protein
MGPFPTRPGRALRPWSWNLLCPAPLGPDRPGSPPRPCSSISICQSALLRCGNNRSCSFLIDASAGPGIGGDAGARREARPGLCGLPRSSRRISHSSGLPPRRDSNTSRVPSGGQAALEGQKSSLSMIPRDSRSCSGTPSGRPRMAHSTPERSRTEQRPVTRRAHG